MNIHHLKTDPQAYDDVKSGKKLFEIRWNDRNYQVGDQLQLYRTKYTDKEMKSGKPLEYCYDASLVSVIHIMLGPIYGLEDGWVIMSIALC